METVPVLGLIVAWSEVYFFFKKDLQCDWGCFKACESFLILLICLKDEAVTEAPKEVMTILLHCEALFRKNGRKVQMLQKCSF